MTSPHAPALRLFVAVFPPPEALADLAAAVGDLAVYRAKPTAVERWHFTMAFIGEVPEPRLPEVRAVLDEPFRGADGITVRIAGGSRFADRRGKTVVWAGLRGDVERFTALGEAVRERLASAKLPCDHKRFRPHLTIARSGDRVPAGRLADDLRALDAYEGPPWAVPGLALVRSHLGGTIRYETLATRSIGGEGS